LTATSTAESAAPFLVAAVSWLLISDSNFTDWCNRFAANKIAMKIAEKAAKQADTARRRTEVQEKFAAMTEQEQEAWRLARQAKRQSRKSETEQKRSRLQQVNFTKHPHLADHIGAPSSYWHINACITIPPVLDIQERHVYDSNPNCQC